MMMNFFLGGHNNSTFFNGSINCDWEKELEGDEQQKKLNITRLIIIAEAFV